jgi:hypothetical protein
MGSYYLKEGLENCVEGKEIHLNLILNRKIISGEKNEKNNPAFYRYVGYVSDRSLW